MTDLFKMFKINSSEKGKGSSGIKLNVKGRPWTEEEDKYLISKYPNTSMDLIAESLGRTNPSVIARARKLRIKGHVFGTFRRDAWTREEDDYIIKNYAKVDTKIISEKLGRSEHSIVNRASVLRSRGEKSKGGYRRTWTPEEDEYLIKYYSVKDLDEMIKELDRTKMAIQIRVHVLRSEHGKLIGGSRARLRWTQEEDKYLIENYGKVDIEEIAKVLDRSTGGVHSRFKALKS